jgi:hypothetical protein
MAFMRAIEHGENPILVDCERNAETSLFEQRCIANHGTKLLWGGIAANPPGYVRQARALTSGEKDCVSVLIRRVNFHGSYLTGRACSSGSVGVDLFGTNAPKIFTRWWIAPISAVFRMPANVFAFVSDDFQLSCN